MFWIAPEDLAAGRFDVAVLQMIERDDDRETIGDAYQSFATPSPGSAATAA